MRHAASWVLAAAAFAAACNGSSTDHQAAALSRIDVEPPGDHCAAGGQAVRTGLDGDGDGVLSDAEVTSTEYLCAQAGRALLLRSVAEPAGEHCAAGGTAVLAGLDADGDGVLSDAEVDRTSYVCSGAEPQVLVTTAVIAPGDVCPAGGTAIASGRDRDGSGTLEDAEIEQRRTVCGSGLLVRTTSVFGYGSTCPGSGTRVQAGPDADGDGALSDAEVTLTFEVCATDALSFTVQTQADLDYLRQQVSLVRGDVVIASPDLVDVELYGLVVTGAIRVRDCPALQKLVLWPDLVGGDLEVARTPELTDLSIRIDSSFPTAHLQPVLGSLSVTDAPKLGWLAMDEVPSVQGSLQLVRTGARYLMADQLQWVGGELRIESCPQFESAWVSKLARIGGGFVLRDDAAVVDWDDGLRGHAPLTSIGEVVPGGVVVEDDPALLTLHLPRVATIGGGVDVHRNATLGGLALDALGAVSRDYAVSDNPALVHLGGRSAADPIPLTIGGDLSVARNPALLSLAGLDGLTSVTGSVRVADNAALQWFFLPNLSRASSVRIEHNDALAYLGPGAVGAIDLSSLTRLTSVTALEVLDNAHLARLQLPALAAVSSLDVEGNPLLPTCQAQALVAQGSPSSVTIAGNDDAATCP